MSSKENIESTKAEPSLFAVCKSLFRISLTSFGGPAAQITMLAEEFALRGWLPEDEIKKEMTICKLLPGPVGTQFALSLSRRLKGRFKAIAGGLIYLFPPTLLLLLCGILFVTFSQNPFALIAFRGMQGAAVLLIIDSTRRLAKGTSWNFLRIAIATVTALAVFTRPRLEIWLILGSGLVNALAGLNAALVFPFLLLCSFVPTGVARAKELIAFPAENLHAAVQIFFACFKATALVFGTGFASLSVVKHDVVESLGLVTNAQFLNAVAIGQLTPGPVVSATTLMGLWSGGWAGAAFAALGTFLPSFLNTLVIVPIVPQRFWVSNFAARFISGAFPAIVGGLLGFVGLLSKPFLVSLLSFISRHSVGGDSLASAEFFVGIAASSVALFFFRRLPLWALIPVGGIVTFLSFVAFV